MTTMIETMHAATDFAELLADLKELALQEPGVTEASVGHYCLGALAHFVCSRNKGELDILDEPRELTDSEVQAWAQSVSISKLERLLKDRRAALGLGSPACSFPGCPNDRVDQDLFCSDHSGDCYACDGTGLVEGTHCATCDGTGDAGFLS